MILSILIILIILAITYMHFLQGAFTAAISFACALGATLVAFGYYENVINSMAQGGFADYAGGASLILLFMVTFAVLRIGADMLVPSNITLQLYVDKVGSVVFGFLAGLLGAGTFAVAVQMMPMGAAVAGYSPFELRERDVAAPVELTGRNRAADTYIANELVPDKLDAPPAGMLLPADTLALQLVKIASDGSFSGGQSFTAIHPDLPVELFANRLGPDASGKHVIFNTAKQTNVSVGGIYKFKAEPKAFDTEVGGLRNGKTNLSYKPSSSDVLVVVRLQIKDVAAEKDGMVRLPVASARLVIDGETFYPIGSMEDKTHLGLNRLDDMLFIPLEGTNNGADLVYALPKSKADAFDKKGGDDIRFIEVKLFGRVDLGDLVADTYAGPKDVKVARKPASPLMKEIKPTPKTT